MIRSSPLFLSVLVLGCILGLLYFGGLWLTVRQLNRAPRPLFLFWVSYLLRLGTVLGVFHLILQWAGQDQLLSLLLVSFLGFLLSRTLLISRILPRDRREVLKMTAR